MGEERWLEIGDLHAACLDGVGNDDFLLVEGSGGFYSPIARGALNADLAAGLGMPVLLVVPHRLGAVNQTLLAIEAMKMRGAGSNTAASVAWPSQPGAGGMCTTTHDMAAAKAEATKPTQTTRRARA